MGRRRAVGGVCSRERGKVDREGVCTCMEKARCIGRRSDSGVTVTWDHWEVFGAFKIKIKALLSYSPYEQRVRPSLAQSSLHLNCEATCDRYSFRLNCCHTKSLIPGPAVIIRSNEILLLAE